jgi:hypothetical protein
MVLLAYQPCEFTKLVVQMKKQKSRDLKTLIHPVDWELEPYSLDFQSQVYHVLSQRNGQPRWNTDSALSQANACISPTFYPQKWSLCLKLSSHRVDIHNDFELEESGLKGEVEIL